MRLKDIPFSNNISWADDFNEGTHQVVLFPNGYGVSIITGKYTYSNKERPYELAELIWDNNDDINASEPIFGNACIDIGYHVCYDHYCDVIGYLTERQVNAYINIIKRRKPHETWTDEDEEKFQTLRDNYIELLGDK